MASLKSICLVYFHFLLACNAISSFNDVLDNADTCEQKCTKSYALHTDSNSDEDLSCQRGCRLYTVTKFITADEPKQMIENEDGKSPALILCHRSCIEAYNETSTLKSACQVGCEKQETISLENEKLKAEEDAKTSGIHLMRPIMQVREVTSKVMGMLSIVQTSLTTYFLGENNEMVAVEGPVKITVRLNNPEIPFEQRNLDNTIEQLGVERQSPFAQSIQRDDVIKVPVLDDSTGFATFYDNLGHVDVFIYAFMVAVLMALLFLVFLMIYRRAASQKSQKLKVSTIPVHALPVKLVRPEDLTKLSLMDEEEAPELPIKFKLPGNII